MGRLAHDPAGDGQRLLRCHCGRWLHVDHLVVVQAAEVRLRILDGAIVELKGAEIALLPPGLQALQVRAAEADHPAMRVDPRSAVSSGATKSRYMPAESRCVLQPHNCPNPGGWRAAWLELTGEERPAERGALVSSDLEVFHRELAILPEEIRHQTSDAAIITAQPRHIKRPGAWA